MRWYIRILYGLLRLLGLLPLRALHALGAGFGWLAARTDNPMRRKAEHTLTRINTSFGEEKHQFLREALAEAGKSFFEVTKIWTGDPARTLALVREVDGGERFDAALAAGRGLIVAAPHLGCFELLNYWLCHRTKIAIAYRPPRQPELEPLLIRARGGLAAEQVRAEGSAGVRTLFRRLASGGVVGILPDQEPKQGEGKFAPFFGRPALTMVLLSRLAQRTGATVLFAFAERLPRGEGYVLHFLPAPEGIADPDLPAAVAALNRGVENCIRLAPVQYQWHYKRFSAQPDKSA
ncbi:MAG: lipid A biosynthesis acyltransferase [Rudaea sp.]|uniref:LpxL/LpxP family acyltransferase n=1 Tax=Rudaea sp. TaxID=2136325 RepID=UPI0039E3A31F